MNSLNLYKDNNYLIQLSKDHWRGLTIQVCRFGYKNITGTTGEQVSDRTPHVAWQRSVKASHMVSETNEFIMFKPEDFKREVQEMIAEAKVRLGKLKAVEEMMDGVFVDYIPTTKEFNE